MPDMSVSYGMLHNRKPFLLDTSSLHNTFTICVSNYCNYSYKPDITVGYFKKRQ